MLVENKGDVDSILEQHHVKTLPELAVRTGIEFRYLFNLPEELLLKEIPPSLLREMFQTFISLFSDRGSSESSTSSAASSSASSSSSSSSSSASSSKASQARTSENAEQRKRPSENTRDFRDRQTVKN
jgi:hypothetical protein